MQTNEQMDGLLIKQLLNEASQEEASVVAAWRAADPDHEKYYQDFRWIWKSSKLLAESSTVDAEAAWERFRQRTGESREAVSMPFRPAARKRIWSIAAAAVVLIGLVTWNFLGGSGEVLLASGDAVRIDTLPDGSVITLNKHSTLAYTPRFNEKDRNVVLNGEAFFNVAPNKQKPFGIKVGKVDVHVVGTSFNVREETGRTEVIVETGIVKVSVAESTVKLLPNEKVVVPKNSNRFDVTKNEDLLYNYYRTKTFECRNTPLFELVDALNKTYDTRIVIAEERTRNLRMTSTFKEMPLNDILKVITATFNLSIEQQHGKIILK